MAIWSNFSRPRFLRLFFQRFCGKLLQVNVAGKNKRKEPRILERRADAWASSETCGRVLAPLVLLFYAQVGFQIHDFRVSSVKAAHSSKRTFRRCPTDGTVQSWRCIPQCISPATAAATVEGSGGRPSPSEEVAALRSIRVPE